MATPTKAPKQIKVRYVERAVPADEPLVVNDFDGRPEVQVLGVEQREGAGFATFENVWKLALIWR